MASKIANDTSNKRFCSACLCQASDKVCVNIAPATKTRGKFTKIVSKRVAAQ